MTVHEIAEKVNSAKRRVLDMCISAGKGHVTTTYSCAEIVATLYYMICNDVDRPAKSMLGGS